MGESSYTKMCERPRNNKTMMLLNMVMDDVEAGSKDTDDSKRHYNKPHYEHRRPIEDDGRDHVPGGYVGWLKVRFTHSTSVRYISHIT
jgi:hypothetical protein